MKFFTTSNCNSIKSMCLWAVTLYLIFGISANLHGQSQKKIDSLKGLVNQKPSTLNRLELYSQLGYEYWTVDAWKSIDYGRQGLKLALKLKDTAKAGFNYRVIGVAYWVLGDNALAMEYLLKSRDIYSQLNDSKGLADVILNIGLIYSDGLDGNLAKKYYTQALSIFDSLNEEGRVATALTKIATELIQQDSIGKAKQFLQQAIEIHSQNEFLYGISEAYNRMGVLYRQNNNLLLSEEYLIRSMNLSSSMGDQEGLNRTYVDLGWTYLKMKDYDNAQHYFQKAVDQSFIVSSKKWRLQALKGLSRTYSHKGNLSEAFTALSSQQELQDSLSKESKAMIMSNLLSEFETRQQIENLNKSTTLLEQSKRNLENKNLRLLILMILSFLSLVIVLLLLRNFKVTNRQMLLERENQKKLAEIEQKHAALLHEQLENDLQQKQRELTSYALNFVQKNALLQQIKDELREHENHPLAQNIIRKLKESFRIDHEWKKFKIQFENANTNFLENLHIKHPGLSQLEIRHCILIRMNLTVKECAVILSVTPGSSKTLRSRLRKKLGLETDDSLFEYLVKLG